MFRNKFFKILLFISVIVFGAYIYIYNLYKIKITDIELNKFAFTINKSEQLPDKFIHIYSEIENYDFSKSTNEYLFTHFFDRVLDLKLKKCVCFETNYTYHGFVNTFERISLGIQLDKRVTKRKCVEYYLQNQIRHYNIKGINNLSEYIFKKKLKDLNDEEMIRLSVISSNPHYLLNDKRKKILYEKVLFWKKNIQNNLKT